MTGDHDAEGVELEGKEILPTIPPVGEKMKGLPGQNETKDGPRLEDVKKEVSFHQAVTVTHIPPSATPTSSTTGREDTTTEEPLKMGSPASVEVDICTSTMEQLHNEGTDKTYQERQLGVQPVVVRRMKKLDIETGNKAWREFTALPVWDFQEAMNPLERKKAILEGLAKNKTKFDKDKEDKGARQFRLRSKTSDTKLLQREYYWILSYLYWTLRASFISVIITDLLAFFFFTWIWACSIYVGALVSPRCFVVAGTPLSEIEDWKEQFYFMDAFQLSWTTFATVGYGVVYPQVNKGANSVRTDCMVFSTMVSLESFVGVLFAAFCSSIIFGKIARIQSIAAIEWSSPLVVRYGTGVAETKPDVEKLTGDEGDCDSDNSSDSDADDDVVDAQNSYGSELDNSHTSILDMSDRSSMTASRKSRGNKIRKFPPPVLEFRIINSYHNQQGSEIMNATLRVFATTEAAKSIESLQLSESKNDALTAARLLKMSMELTQKTGRALTRTREACFKASQSTGNALRRTSTVASKTTGSLVQRVNRAIVRPSVLGVKSPLSSPSPDTIYENQPEMAPFNIKQEIQREIASLAFSTQSVRNMEIDEGSKLVPRRIFSKMEIETDTHPFFKRVWNIRHVLDENSPILSAKAKRIIQKHKGKWPQDICDDSFIRNNIHFHQIIVQLSGTHNSSGSDVFGMHIYGFSSLNIGYRFASCLHTDEHGTLHVDRELLSDVREQRGGGGEKIRGIVVDESGSRRGGLLSLGDGVSIRLSKRWSGDGGSVRFSNRSTERANTAEATT